MSDATPGTSVQTGAQEDALQAGIFFRAKERPPDHWRGVVINVSAAAEKAAVRDALAQLWAMWSALGQGHVRDLARTRSDDPEVKVDGGGLTVLLGFGRSLFGDERHMPILFAEDLRPPELARLMPAAPFPSLPWAKDARPLEGQGDFFVQLFGASELVVNRAIVEAQKLIDDRNLPLQIVTFYRGAHREDGRSWIDFHDGVNNLRSEERRTAIEITGADPAWLRGGTFAAFLQIQVDLKAWRRLTREQQELLVGRHKLSGCPVVSATLADDRTAQLAFKPGCPLRGFPTRTAQAIGPEPLEVDPDFIDPPPASGLLKTSHIHRSNFNRGSPAADGNNRIFRQGYEFLEPSGSGGLHVGLNFISFQRSLLALRRILGTTGWLGDVNFGGTAEQPLAAPPLPLMSVASGGLYAIPPRGDPFPGAPLFG
ncbi:MAG TPA: hypothetical protein VFQ61_21800 [Polyangiaceae bacterium]|nr:hypothetical protein [Polyangiaceae bacterium]